MAKNALLAVISLVLTLGFLEGTARLYFAAAGIQPPEYGDTFEDSQGYMRFDDYLGWSLKPGYSADGININPLGFRTTLEDISEECRDKYRVLLLGDSMLFGYGADQRYIFSELLNRRLEDCCFINTGVEGYSTVQEYLVAKKYTPFLKPHWIALFYTQENDMWWNADSLTPVKVGG